MAWWIGNLGVKIAVTRDKAKIHGPAETSVAQRYLKYREKEFLKVQQLRDFLRVVAPNKVRTSCAALTSMRAITT